MAEDAVDRILGSDRRPCATARLPLVGAAAAEALRSLPQPKRLVRRYGIEAAAVAAMAGGDRSLLEPVAEAAGVLGVELLFGVRHEGALGIDDLLDRRTRVGLIPEQRHAVEQAAAGLMQAPAA